VARYEAPNAANRWDRPLFGLTPGDALPYDAIKAALFEGKAPTPHLSTRAVRPSTPQLSFAGRS